MNVSIEHIVLSALLVLPAGAAAGDTSWLEIAGSYYNPDWEFRENESGMRFSGRYQRGPWYAGATYNTIDTRPVDLPGIIGLRGLPFGNWREVTAGRSLTLSPGTALELEAAYQAVTVFGSTESGYMLASALDHRFSNRLSGSIRLSYLQLEAQDWRITGQLLVATGDRSAIVARIDDFAQFDFTWYELGMRFFF